MKLKQITHENHKNDSHLAIIETQENISFN